MKIKNRIKFAVAGGDMRQAKLSELLNAEGHEVSVFAIERQTFAHDIKVFNDFAEAAMRSDCVILPIPLVKEDDKLNAPLSNATYSINTILENIPSGKLALGGIIRQTEKDLALQYGIKLIDYFDREELAVLNAIPTAEGAIQIAMEETPFTLHGARCLVIGSGRVGKILADRLKGLYAKVTVSARKYGDFAWIYAEGYSGIDTRELEPYLPYFDIIFNTVPSRVLDYQRLLKLKNDCLIIDLASKPGGVDFSAAAQIGIKAIWALSLPGKVAPASSAKAIRDTVYNILIEEGYA